MNYAELSEGLTHFYMLVSRGILSIFRPVQPQEGEGPGNPVGQLQELTQKKLMKPPIYEFNTEQGPPHAREFICIVKLGKIQEKGEFIGFDKQKFSA